jgi:hypothetical protein
VSGQQHAPASLYPGKDLVPIVQEAGWSPGPVWTGAENLAPTGIRIPDFPARSQSLCRLSYPAHTTIWPTLLLLLLLLLVVIIIIIIIQPDGRIILKWIFRKWDGSMD